MKTFRLWKLKLPSDFTEKTDDNIKGFTSHRTAKDTRRVDLPLLHQRDEKRDLITELQLYPQTRHRAGCASENATSASTSSKE